MLGSAVYEIEKCAEERLEAASAESLREYIEERPAAASYTSHKVSTGRTRSRSSRGDQASDRELVATDAPIKSNQRGADQGMKCSICRGKTTDRTA